MNNEDDVDDDSSSNFWCYLPEAPLFQVFSYLKPIDVLRAGLACRQWYIVSQDDLLWRAFFHRDFGTDPALYPSCRPKTWLSEYKRLCYHIPIVQSELLTEHRHQVLHVSFAHDGRHFATCSKDGYVLVWTSDHPARIRHQRDMKTHSWKYTQYSQFNETDTLLLVSGVHFGTPHSTSGEIAVFSLEEGFQLQCRVMNKPYDIFGTWYSDQYLLSGDLKWLAHLVSSSQLWLNKASQESESEHVPVRIPLYRFYNHNTSSVRAIMVADCLSEATPEALIVSDTPQDDGSSGDTPERGNPVSHRDLRQGAQLRRLGVRLELMPRCRINDSLDYARPFVNSPEYCANTPPDSDSESCSSCGETGDSAESGEELANRDKYLIFTTGSKTYTPHQVGFKRMRSIQFPKRVEPGPSLRERIALRKQAREMQAQQPDQDWLDFESVADRFDRVDQLIDLHGHIIGMALSPDHRHLYVNTRPWPSGYVISNPLEPPPIAQEIDIHVIDLVTLREVGRMLRAHKAYTPNSECFFIFLDVCEQYVASGAEDRHGYLWDRHYGCCLAKFPHEDVVNSVAFNPRDPEMLVTTSDDESIKVWRSVSRCQQLGLITSQLPHAVEVRTAQRSRFPSSSSVRK